MVTTKRIAVVTCTKYELPHSRISLVTAIRKVGDSVHIDRWPTCAAVDTYDPEEAGGFD